MKNRGIAIVLALFFGGLGVHRFYLGQIKTGFTMLLFFWTLIPMFIALLDVIHYAVMGETNFQKKYGNV